LEGTYSDTAGAEECKPCLAGYYCDVIGLKLDDTEKSDKECP